MADSIFTTRRTFLISGAATLALASTAVRAAGPVRVGVSLPLTGDWAEYGDFIKKSVLMVFDGANKAGGINGRKIELQIEDSRGDPKEAVLIAEKFAANPDIIAEVGDFSSSACMAAAPIYEKAGIIQVSPTSSHPDFTKKGTHMFRVIGTQATEGPFNAKWGVKDLGAKTVATIYINNDWGVASNKYYTDAVKALGGEVVAQEAFTKGEKDFSAIISKIKRANPDVLYLPVFHTDAVAILTQARRLRYRPKVMSPGSLYSPKLIQNGGSTVEGLMSSAVYFPNNPDPVSMAFTKAFQNTYNKTPSMFAAVGFDAASLVLEALKRSGAKDRDAVFQALNTLTGFKGVTGTYDYTKSHDPEKEYAKIMIKGGKWVPAT